MIVTLETPSFLRRVRSAESRSFPRYRKGIISAGLLAPETNIAVRKRCVLDYVLLDIVVRSNQCVMRLSHPNLDHS